jgi:hypothetical protein
MRQGYGSNGADPRRAAFDLEAMGCDYAFARHTFTAHHQLQFAHSVTAQFSLKSSPQCEDETAEILSDGSLQLRDLSSCGVVVVACGQVSEVGGGVVVVVVALRGRLCVLRDNVRRARESRWRSWMSMSSCSSRRRCRRFVGRGVRSLCSRSPPTRTHRQSTLPSSKAPTPSKRSDNP